MGSAKNALATHVATRADLVWEVPQSWSMAEAATGSLPLSHATWQCPPTAKSGPSHALYYPFLHSLQMPRHQHMRRCCGLFGTWYLAKCQGKQTPSAASCGGACMASWAAPQGRQDMEILQTLVVESGSVQDWASKCGGQ